MRCFRVDEDTMIGIQLSADEQGNLYVEVGDNKVRLERELSDKLRTTKERVVSELRRHLLEGEIQGEPLSQREVEELQDISERADNEMLSLMYADLADDGTMIVKEKRKSIDALVLVETASGPNGRLSYTSCMFEEYLDQNARQVRRRYRNVFPPPGIRVVAEGTGPTTGDKYYLLRMTPSSSFRIERTGDLGDCSPVLTVVWKGRKGRSGESPLQVFPLKKYQAQSD